MIMGQSKHSMVPKVHGDISIGIKAEDLRDLISLNFRHWNSKGETCSVYEICFILHELNGLLNIMDNLSKSII